MRQLAIRCRTSARYRPLTCCDIPGPSGRSSGGSARSGRFGHKSDHKITAVCQLTAGADHFGVNADRDRIRHRSHRESPGQESSRHRRRAAVVEHSAAFPLPLAGCSGRDGVNTRHRTPPCLRRSSGSSLTTVPGAICTLITCREPKRNAFILVLRPHPAGCPCARPSASSAIVWGHTLVAWHMRLSTRKSVTWCRPRVWMAFPPARHRACATTLAVSTSIGLTGPSSVSHNWPPRSRCTLSELASPASSDGEH